MASLLPQQPGYLPYFLLTTSALAITHSVVCYTATPEVSCAHFSGPKAGPKTSVLAHLYGLKTFYSSLIRLYAAYRTTNPDFYMLALITYIGELGFFGGELVLYGNVRRKEGIFPILTGGVGIAWMLLQKSFYLGP